MKILLYTLVAAVTVQADKTSRRGMRGYREVPSITRQLNNPYYVYPEDGGNGDGDNWTNDYYYPEVDDGAESREEVVSPVNDFVPLSCNNNVADSCVLWSESSYASKGATTGATAI